MPGKRKKEAASRVADKGAANPKKLKIHGEEEKSDIRVVDEISSGTGKSTFKLVFEDKQIVCERRNGDHESEKPELIFTHGAGGGISNPATASFAEGLSKISPVVCFQGTMNLKSRVKSFHTVIEHEGSSKALGGRSMGARAAVVTALESEKNQVDGLVLVSYPLVGATKGDLRDSIPKDLGDDVDVIFIVGSEDSMCDLMQLNEVRRAMTATSWLVEVEGADHGMSLKDKQGVEVVRQQTGMIAGKWLQERSRDKTYCSVGWNKDAHEIECSEWAVEEDE